MTFSLHNRLFSGLALSLVLMIVFMGWLQIYGLHQISRSIIGSRLQHDAETILSSLSFDVSGVPRLAEQSIDAIYKQVNSGHYYQISFEHAPLIRSRSLWDRSLDVPVIKPGKSEYWQLDDFSNQALLIVASSYSKQNHAVTITMAEDLTPVNNQLISFVLMLMLMGGIFLVGILLLQAYIVKRSLKSLHRVSAELSDLEQGEKKQLSEEVPREILPLVSEVNHLLSLLGQRLARSRNALGNLAHALKTPLNLLVQLTEKQQLEKFPELRDELLEYTERMRRLVDHELTRARLAGSRSAGQLFDPSADLPALVEVLKRVHQNKYITIDCHYPAEKFQGLDRDDMLELIGNLLDNACKWASHRVLCNIDFNVGSHHLRLSVEDDGEGVDEQRLKELTQRGVRIDELTPGHGLGLAIVKDIAALYGASLSFSQSGALGGLLVIIEFENI
ncbi:MAG: ATP-binding protein [Gammaproteobacteria bacterium]|nr:ATP-binding protein [Gammaproteobacteria bacterium]